METWEKRACSSLMAVNYHADLFSSAAYQCLHQEYVGQCPVQTP